MKPIMNLDEVEFDDVEENGVYITSRGQISDHIGAKKLGYNLTVLPLGRFSALPLPPCRSGNIPDLRERRRVAVW